MRENRFRVPLYLDAFRTHAIFIDINFNKKLRAITPRKLYSLLNRLLKPIKLPVMDAECCYLQYDLRHRLYLSF